MNDPRPYLAGEAPDLLAFLGDPDSYPGRPAVEAIETHMSRVFLAGDRAYKIKKPIRLGFADLTGLEARRESCERELSVNRRLAPDVYLAVVPISRVDGNLVFDGPGEPIEWVLVMRRLAANRLLDKAIGAGAATSGDVERVCDTLAEFYRSASRIDCPPGELLAHWRGLVRLAEGSLRDPLFALSQAKVAPLVDALHRFLDEHGALITARLIGERIVDGHGDLRPEHVWLGPPVLLIDRLEFDARLRRADPFDEACFLALECDMLGATWIAPQLINGLSDRLGDSPPPALLRFYRAYRAALRARLSIEHLRDAAPRTPEKWPRKANAYLDLGLAALGA